MKYSVIFLLLFAQGIFAQPYTSMYDEQEIINEKIVLFANKNVYLAGESLEFNFVTYDAIYNRIIDVSKVAYIEVLDQDGTVISETKIFLNEGRASGKIALSNKLSTDYYYVRAYTQYMRNFGVQNFFHTRISVVNTFKYLSSKDFIDDTIPQYAIRIKNNELIDSLSATIGIALKNFKKENFISCSVVDSSGSIQTKRSVYDDVLLMDFFPSLGMQYSVNLQFADSIYVTTLPLPKQRTDIIDVNENNNELGVTIFRKSQGDSIRILKNNIVIFTEKVLKNKVFFPIPNLPEGILTFQLVSDSGIVLSESLFYNKYEENAQIHITSTDKTSTRSNVSVQFPYKDALHSLFVVEENKYEKSSFINPLFVNDCISLFDSISYSEIESAFFDSEKCAYLLLKPLQLKPTISNKYIAELEGDVLKGRLTMAESGSNAAKKDIICTIPDSLHYFFDVVTTGDDGYFTLLITEQYKTPNIVFSVYDSTQSYTLKVEPEFEQNKLQFAKEIYKPEQDMAEFLKNQMLALQVNDAYANQINIKTDGIGDNFYGKPTNVVKFNEFVHLPLFQEYVKELMEGVYVIKKKKKKYIRISDDDSQGFTGDNPLLLVNGIPVRDHQKVILLDPKNVDYVRIVNNKIYFKGLIFDGILEVITKSIVKLDKLNNKNIFIIDYIIPQKSNAVVEVESIPSNIPIFKNAINTSFSENPVSTFETTDQTGVFELKGITISKDMHFSIGTQTLIVQ